MDYNKFIDEIEKLCNEDFTMESFQNAGSINRRINRAFSKRSPLDKERELSNFLSTKAYLDDVVFYKLKGKLGYEDEVIRKLVSYIGYSDIINEVYVIDGYTAINMKVNSDNFDVDTQQFIPEGDFSEITSLSFNSNDNDLMIKKLVVSGLNSFFREQFNNEDILKLKNSGYISSNIVGLYIFMNSSLAHLDEINKNNLNEVVKMFVKYGEDIYYFDVKMRDNYLVLQYNNYEVHKLSEKLDSKEMVKTNRM